MLSLQAIKYEFHASGHAYLIEDLENIISHDLLLERGVSPRAVAIGMACATLVSGAVGWIALHLSAAAGAAVIAAYVGLLVAAMIWLGALPLRVSRRTGTVHRSAAT